ncbi:hypothetical protein SESBI_12624 [Sesbania bispinosa]|nr:hypothetical protein SESBI_12624 [Sesbania bispinosa]
MAVAGWGGRKGDARGHGRGLHNLSSTIEAFSDTAIAVVLNLTRRLGGRCGYLRDYGSPLPPFWIR